MRRLPEVPGALEHRHCELVPLVYSSAADWAQLLPP